MTHPDAEALARFDRLESDERVALLDHLGACGGCRKIWLAHDPSRLFALLGRVDLPDAALDRLSERIALRIDGLPAHGRLLRAASLAASLSLAALVGGYLYEVPRPGAPEIPAMSVSPLTAGAGEDLVPPAMPARRSASDPVRGVELLDSPGAGKLVNLIVGETRVVMIFDEAFDI